MTASAPQTRARPRYSVSSNGPMAFTVQSYVIADTSAIVLPTSNAHHAQRSPRRKAVTAMATRQQPEHHVVDAVHPEEHRHVSGGHRRRARELRPGAAGEALVPGGQDRLATWSEQVIRRNAAAIAPHATYPTSTMRMRIQRESRCSRLRGLRTYVGSPPVSLRIHRMHVCPKSTPAPYIIGQAPAITLMSC